MMKLTNQQIEYVENYIISKDIKWYELQVELTDHMVSSMEEFWVQNPKLSFEQVKENTFTQFSKSELKAIEKERKLLLLNEYNKEQRKMVGTYLKFPKILGSILLVVVSFKLSFYFENTAKYILVLFLSSYIFAVPMLYFYHKNRKINGKRFLAIETVHPWLTLLGLPQLGMCFNNPFKEEINQYPAVVFVFCLIWALGILLIASATYLQKQSISSVKKQYQLT